MSNKHIIDITAKRFFVDLFDDNVVHTITVLIDTNNTVILDLDHLRNCNYKFHADTSINNYRCLFIAEGHSVLEDRVNLYRIIIPKPTEYCHCAMEFSKLFVNQM